MEYLIKHAMDNVWCAPDQDHQFLFKPNRVSNPRGVRGFVEVEWNTLNLPDSTNKYQVYQIGQLSKYVLDIITTVGVWLKLTDVVNHDSTLVEVYNSTGLQYPRFESYLMLTRTGNLILAVKEQPKLGSLFKETLYLRFYSNAYLNSTRADVNSERVYTKGFIVTSRAEVVVLQNEINSLRAANNGVVLVYHNGLLVEHASPDLVLPGDLIEYVQDTTVKKVVEFSIKELETFTSTLDSVRKYLLFRHDPSNTTIDYVDDIDLYFTSTVSGVKQGRFYHRGLPSSLRMVTHQTYSIPVQKVLDFNTIKNFENPENLKLTLYIRDSGFERPLVFEHNRIHELLKLPAELALATLVGANSTVPNWRAATLEASYYTGLMRSKLEDLDRESVIKAYGYNAISGLVGATPKQPVDLAGLKVVYQPLVLQNRATAFEYNVQGKLLGWHHHSAGELYILNNPLAHHVETLYGFGGLTSSTVFDLECVDVTGSQSFKAYKTIKLSNGPYTEGWKEAVRNIDYVVSLNQVIWLLDLDTNYVAVKTLKDFYLKDFNVGFSSGYLKVDLITTDPHGCDSILVTGPTEIPSGNVEVFLNGYSLIPNLDYVVKWPSLVINNKEFIDHSLELQKVVVRTTGFCTPDLKLQPTKEFGYVEHNLLSRNKRFDIREDQVLRIVVDGLLQTKDRLMFAENTGTIEPADYGVWTEGVRNGAPYLVDDIIVPMSDLIDRPTMDYRAQSQVVDNLISDYLTLHYPEPVIEGPSIIAKRHRLYSPFIASIHSNILNGYLYPPEIKGQYSEQDIRDWLKPYEWLIEFDLAFQKLDARYVSFEPHEFNYETELDYYQYNFLTRVIKTYLGDLLNITSHVRIKDGVI